MERMRRRSQEGLRRWAEGSVVGYVGEERRKDDRSRELFSIATLWKIGGKLTSGAA